MTQPRKLSGSSVQRLLFRVTNYGITIYALKEKP